MRLLEGYLGPPLFQRLPRGVALTPSALVRFVTVRAASPPGDQVRQDRRRFWRS
jgi:DNA-binding transcriptional LysR family regulator